MKTKEIIIEKAREEFLEKGFQEASLRKIANQVGITATALYRHYSSKEDIFEAVVELAVKEWEALCVNEEIRQTGNARKNGIEAMWRDDLQTKIMVDLIYKDFEIQKILFFRSKGTKYENYLHELVTRVQTATLKFMKEIEEDGVSISKAPSLTNSVMRLFFTHLLSSRRFLHPATKEKKQDLVCTYRTDIVVDTPGV